MNYFTQALTAFRRAVRARRRLMRLAPEISAAVVVQREAERRERQRQWMARLEPVLQKVYGPAADLPPGELHHDASSEWGRNGAEKVQFTPGKRRKIQATLAERDLWMTAGDVALERYQRLQPHRHVSLGALARLFDLASTFGRLAVGLELSPGETKQRRARDCEPWDTDPDEALHRAYGGKGNAEPGVYEARLTESTRGDLRLSWNDALESPRKIPIGSFSMRALSEAAPLSRLSCPMQTHALKLNGEMDSSVDTRISRRLVSAPRFSTAVSGIQ